MWTLDKSKQAFTEAKQYMPGGVNSPVRSYRSVGSTPPFISAASGSRIYDIDNNEYIDYVLSWGPMILGHAHPEVVAALQEAIPRGTSYGAPTLLETEVAKKIQAFMPSMEMMRMVNSGTEATMSAIRVARGVTGRDGIVKFIGCYHGHSDSLLVKAGSGLATFGVPDSPGVPQGVAANTITIPYNDIERVRALFKEKGHDIAGVIVEPVAGNMGCVPPLPGFLECLREETRNAGALLIFDEVMCGFRASSGGAQKYYHIDPDLTCLGKIVGGGMPMAVFGGKAEYMSQVAPSGPIYQAGTLSGNPLAMTAGLATLSILQRNPTVFKQVEAATDMLCEGLLDAAHAAGVPVQVQHVGSMFTLFFSEVPVTNFEEANACNMEQFKQFFRYNLSHGIYYAPSQFESNFMSLSHRESDIKTTLQIAKEAFCAIAQQKNM
ncbi:glutamate-1-semialdehyde aminotransferase [Veillonella montpellierensis DNF00314]|uniref:Glutamate-1-semialdehyde 2,1-aminomutase n=1 Tax=Veillonella montpellierensis DNF00314 TaxID=1401067 RepID=A0A096AKN5_9FIRM|nr:glutamate-1-semialdehyde 2,1-aminomutase [Veillonella montpellierensis]KGF47360.1 glutamate-1-semialdehyde aminotransferase [Veillonella montpellierensis DNF00314]